MSSSNERKPVTHNESSLHVLSLALVQRLLPNNPRQNQLHKYILRVLSLKVSNDTIHNEISIIELMKKHGMYSTPYLDSCNLVVAVILTPL